MIQTAFRQYRNRVTSERQLEAERNAAIVIQSYYRRYKQYCYFKKLHRAAILIQKHFRLYKAGKGGKERSAPSTPFEDDDATLLNANDAGFWNEITSNLPPSIEPEQKERDGNGCFRIQVTPEELLLWKQHVAAIRIQHAFRYTFHAFTCNYILLFNHYNIFPVYRGHYMRKRQAAARKIQKFMRESRQK